MELEELLTLLTAINAFLLLAIYFRLGSNAKK